MTKELYFKTDEESKVEGDLTLGNTVKFDNMHWLVCHVDYVKREAYLACSIIVQETKFGSDTIYANSTLRQVAKAFEDQMSPGALARMKNVTVSGVTSKVFAASYEQLVGDFMTGGEFSYFNSNEKRICKYNDKPFDYWTSSRKDNDYVWKIHNTGDYGDGRNNPSYSNGFRPFICISL